MFPYRAVDRRGASGGSARAFPCRCRESSRYRSATGPQEWDMSQFRAARVTAENGTRSCGPCLSIWRLCNGETRIGRTPRRTMCPEQSAAEVVRLWGRRAMKAGTQTSEGERCPWGSSGILLDTETSIDDHHASAVVDSKPPFQDTPSQAP